MSRFEQLVDAAVAAQFDYFAWQLRDAVRGGMEPQPRPPAALAAPESVHFAVDVARGGGPDAPLAHTLVRTLLMYLVTARLAPINVEHRRRRTQSRFPTHDGRDLTIPELLAALAVTAPAKKPLLLGDLSRASLAFRDLAFDRAAAMGAIARELGFADALALFRETCGLDRRLGVARQMLNGCQGVLAADGAVREREAALFATPLLALGRVLPALARFRRAHFAGHGPIRALAGWRPASAMRRTRLGPGPMRLRTIAIAPLRSRGYSPVLQWLLAFHELGHAFHAAAPRTRRDAWVGALLDYPLMEVMPAVFESFACSRTFGAWLLGSDPASVDAALYEGAARRAAANLALFGGPVPYLLDAALLDGEPAARIEQRFATVLGAVDPPGWGTVPERGAACWYRMSSFPLLQPEEYLLGRTGDRIHAWLARDFGTGWPIHANGAWERLARIAADTASAAEVEALLDAETTTALSDT